MLRFTRFGLCFASVAATAFLIVSVRKPSADPTSVSRSIHEWDIPELAVHLNRMGVEVRLRSIPRQGPVGRSAFLTTTAKEWNDLNALTKDPTHIEEWGGTLYCERLGESHMTYLADQWGEYSLTVGPFIFYGDVELLIRVRDALASAATASVP
jgi:hypothetical protein